MPSENLTLDTSTDAVCLNYFKICFVGMFHFVTACFTLKMASNLACEGLLAAVAAHRVSRPFKGLSTGLQEVVGPEKLI